MAYKRISIPKGLVMFGCLGFPDGAKQSMSRCLSIATSELLNAFVVCDKGLEEGDPALSMSPDAIIESYMRAIGNDLVAAPRRADGMKIVQRFSVMAWAVRKLGDADFIDHLNNGGGVWFGLSYLDDESASSGYELEFSVELDECLVPDFQAPKIIRRMADAKKAIRLH